jgi:hypothetical protein
LSNAFIFHAADKLPELIFIIGSIAPKMLSLDAARVGNRVVLETAGTAAAAARSAIRRMDGRTDECRQRGACMRDHNIKAD